ncbi:Sec23/Sec24 protein transport family protein [Heracleum sosnowskyi]|uniref:Sec23/Sec24 protein transport family protein n=1 Tax=Heracleum sosnowskyi TaxID=360622 RepID=A0AAD8MTY3_9APIA|nr:Sec23/Sec24 protein transport family protein [Heracleum sosnowskyi]
MSQCRSFGSNYRPSSQPKKISIGIVVDQPTKAKPRDIREDAAATAVPVTRNLGSSKVDTMENMRKYEKVKDPSRGKQNEAEEKEGSPRVSTRSFQQHLPSSQGVCDAQQARGTMFNQSQKSNGGLQTDDGLQKKFSIGIFAMKGQGDGSSNRVVEVPFPTAQELKVPVKEVAQEKAESTENKGSDILRTKIWEALGTVSTPTKQFSNSQTLKTCTDNLEPELNSDKKKSSDMKSRQNSDTIESDSDSPNHTMKGPVTRSLTRKRPTKVQQRKAKNAPSSSNKHKEPEKNIFSFEEGRSRKIISATTIGGSVSKSEKKKSSSTEPRKLHFSKHNNADETRKVTDSSKKEDHMESSSGLKNGVGGLCGFSLKGNRDTYQKGNRDAYQNPIMENADNLGDNYESMFPENVDEEEMVPSLKNIVEPQFDFSTPTLRMKPTTETYFYGSLPKNDQGKQEDAHSPKKGLKEVSNMENVRSFKSFFASMPERDKKKKETEISDYEEVHEDPCVEKSLPSLKETNTINSPSTSPSEEDGCESSDGSSSTEGHSEAGAPEIVTAQEPERLFRQSKRCRISECADATIFNPSSSPPQVFGKFHGLPSELNEEDGLARAVSLFAMVLERVKSKMKSAANKRSAEILTSVAMEMRLQLQNAELQIQKDVGKLTGIGKTKRRRLETRFQEQQGKLEDIYERFRNEVNVHLQDCKKTLEGLELQQTEFKDIVEEQNASHGKLLIQVEEAISTQLNDAQKRINTVQKSARKKMLQLKYVIAECLKEDALY